MHHIELRVRFGETDIAGHVNNATYLTYLEEARMKFVEDLLEPDDMPLIMAAAHLDFVNQVFFRDQVRIETGISRIGTTSFDMVHYLYREPSHQLALTSITTLVYFDYDKQKPKPVPDKWRKRLAEYTTEPPQSRA